MIAAYFVGTLADLLPFPGGIGGVDAGMIGVLLAFGVASYFKLRATVRGWQRAKVA